jgi:hypothetical protein
MTGICQVHNDERKRNRFAFLVLVLLLVLEIAKTPISTAVFTPLLCVFRVLCGKKKSAFSALF